MNTVKKTNHTKESYSPSEKPEIINLSEKSSENVYQRYKNIEYRMDLVELPKSLKFAGVALSLYPNFSNIGKFHDDYKTIMMDQYAPYTEVGFSGNAAGNYDYIFGCQVKSLKHLPDGLIGVDTGLKRFQSITFRASNVYELVGGEDGPGEGMQIAEEYIKEIWLPKHMDEVAPIADRNNTCFEIKNGDKTYHMNMIEIYKVELNDEPEMCFYIPLKD